MAARDVEADQVADLFRSYQIQTAVPSTGPDLDNVLAGGICPEAADLGNDGITDASWQAIGKGRAKRGDDGPFKDWGN